MPKSRYILTVSICFGLGIFLSQFGDYNPQVLIWLLVSASLLLIIFWNEIYLRLIFRGLISIIVGYAYTDLLGREHLVNFPGESVIVVWLAHANNTFVSSLVRILPEPAVSLAVGLVMGQGSGYTKELKDAFIATGTIHIVAVSGYNVTIVLKLFSEWLRPLGRKAAFITGTLSIIAFIIMVGGQASVVRAGIMGWLFILARFVFRPYHLRNALFIAGFLMLIFSPVIISSIGFQLSFGAMLGLVYFSPLLERGMEKIVWFKYVPKLIVSALRETLAAQLAVAFLILGHFGRFSLVAPLSNILIVPILPLPMFMSIGAGILALTGWYTAVAVLAIPLHLILKYILWVIDFCSRVPYASVNSGKWNWWMVLVAYTILSLLVFWLNRNRQKKEIS